MRVLELSDVEGAAAYAGKLFARWGHEVLRVESARRAVPDLAEELYLHGGKRRVTADYRAPEGRDVIARLASTCDILITDAPPREVREHGLLELGDEGGPSVRASISPFGLSGPYADAPATEATILALGGHAFLMGDPERAPLAMAGHNPSYQAGSFAYVASLAAAMQARRHPGEAPRTIEVSALETVVGLHHATDTGWIANGRIDRRYGNRFKASMGTMLPCADGWLGFSITPQFWEPFVLLLGRPELALEGQVFATVQGRMANRDAFEDIVREVFSQRSKHDLFREGQETWRATVGYLATFEELLNDRHFTERGFWRPLEGDRPGVPAGLRSAGSPFRFVGRPRPVERMASPPGSDNEAVASVRPASAAASSKGGEPEPAARARARARQPLAGVRVLDLTRVWSGPLAARIFGDLGADVICVEAPTNRGPRSVPAGMEAYGGGDYEDPWNRQPVFNKLHRNRRSLCIDLKAPEGREAFLKLAAESDAVTENFSARAMERLGLGFEDLRAVNDRIIYLQMPMFGNEGPYREYIGFGPSVEPMTGLPAVNGYDEDSPRTTGTALVDSMAGVAAAVALVTALSEREQTGRGMRIDLSQQESAIALVGEFALARQLTGREPERMGNAHPRISPHGVYRCSGEDEWIALAATDEEQWAALCRVASAGWEHDARFAAPEARLEHREALDTAIERWTLGQDKHALQSTLMAAGVPAGAVLRADEYLTDPHLLARGYFADLHHERTGTQRYDGSPVLIDGERRHEDWRPAPTLGEHNVELLRDVCELSGEAIASLLDGGVVVDTPPE